MSLDDITKTDTSRKQRRRVGRGMGSGLGKTGGRGSKGEGSRTGGKNRGPLFEGGQFPFWMRLPKRGFTNFAHKTVYVAVQLAEAVKRVKGDEITDQALIDAKLMPTGAIAKLVSGADVKLKLKRKLTVKVKATGSARAAIEAAGGSIVEQERAES
ncbi:MAG: 50S ribosomal protein L15 [Planctomycetes bacterium]|nr:50S ribosomal protein L15 [Planctomycetota bacterium]